jgi:flagellar hook-length control protein FliK
VDAPLDIDVVARASAGSSASTGGRHRSQDDDSAGERGPARHAAASAVAAYGAAVTRSWLSDSLTQGRDLAAAPTQSGDAATPTADGEPLEHAIVKSLKLQWSQGAGEARLQLKPEYLGELSVSLKIQGSVVTAVLQSDSAAVRTWVEEHQGELRRALEGIGLSLDRLVIDADGESGSQQQSTTEDRRQSQPRRNVPAGRFEALL